MSRSSYTSQPNNSFQQSGVYRAEIHTGGGRTEYRYIQPSSGSGLFPQYGAPAGMQRFQCPQSYSQHAGAIAAFQTPHPPSYYGVGRF